MVSGPTTATSVGERREGNNADIRSYLQAAAGGRAAVGGQAAVGGRAAVGGQVAVGDRAAAGGPAAAPVKRKAMSPKNQQAAKRTGYQEEEEENKVLEEAQEEMDVMVDMRRELLGAGLSPQQAAMAMAVFEKGVMALLKEAAKEAVTAAVKEVDRAGADAAEAAASRKWEEDRCRRSILIHNADKWVGHLNNSVSLAEHITAQIHKRFGQAVLVMDAFPVGQWVDNNPPTSVFVTFGSVAQKATFFKMMAMAIQDKKNGWEKLNGISCRDAFPKKMMAEAKRLTQKGFSLRQNGQVATFRVVARGPACAPVLEVKAKTASNMRGRWEIFKEKEAPPPTSRPLPPPMRPHNAATPPWGGRSVQGRRPTPRKSLTGTTHIEDEMYSEDF